MKGQSIEDLQISHRSAIIVRCKMLNNFTDCCGSLVLCKRFAATREDCMANQWFLQLNHRGTTTKDECSCTPDQRRLHTQQNMSGLALVYRSFG